MSRLPRVLHDLTSLAALIGFFAWLFTLLAIFSPERFPQ